MDYRCRACDVEGFGRSCWNCGRADTLTPLYVRADYSLVRIHIPDILYIEGLDDYLKIHLENQKTIVTRMTMKGILEKLPPQNFIRVHRSYIVPFSRIESVRNKLISVAGEEIPIGNSYEVAFFEKFTG